jgi:hypothetical protein
MAVVGFFGGQKAGAKNDGERWGRLEATLDRQGKDIEKLGDKLDKFIEESARGDSDIIKRFDDSIRRLHNRIDEHIANMHGEAHNG